MSPAFPVNCVTGRRQITKVDRWLSKSIFSGNNYMMSRSYLRNLCLYSSRSCMLFVNGSDDDATTCAFSRDVAYLAEQPYMPFVEECPV